MACKCIAQVNEHLREKKAQLNIAFTTEGDQFMTVSVCREDGTLRGKLPVVVCAYCPVCGKKYRPRTSRKKRA